MISQNRKRGRGRPREIPEEKLRSALQWEEGELTDRQRNNRHYAQIAIVALMKNPPGDMSIRPEFTWLYDEARKGKSGRYYRQTILEALGRIESFREIRKVARLVCKDKPTAKDAVVIIRQLRSGEVRPGDSKQLSKEIAATIRQYRIRYRTSKKQVNEALASNLKPLK